jgi:hypothetical protein
VGERRPRRRHALEDTIEEGHQRVGLDESQIAQEIGPTSDEDACGD